MISNLYNLKLGRKLTLLFALFAVTISWTGGLQSQSDEYVTEALQSGAIVYATMAMLIYAFLFLRFKQRMPSLAYAT